MAWQLKTSGGWYLPMMFDDANVTDHTGYTKGLWGIDANSMVGTVSYVALCDKSSDLTVDPEHKVGIMPRGMLTLMTGNMQYNPYGNFGNFAQVNDSAYRASLGDTFGGARMHALTSIINSGVSDICVVPWVVCKKFNAQELSGETQASYSSGTQTVMLSTYLNGAYNGVPYYQAFPHVIEISFDVFCRKSATPDGFGVDAAHTNRVQIGWHGTNRNDLLDNSNYYVSIAPITTAHLWQPANYLLSNSTLQPDVGLATNDLYVTGYREQWAWTAGGGWTSSLRCNSGGLLNIDGTRDCDSANGSNLLWQSWNPDATGVVTRWAEDPDLLTYFDYLTYIDATDSQGGVVRELINKMGFMWADDPTSAVTARPGDGRTTTHVPDRAGGATYGTPLGTDSNGTEETEANPITVIDEPEPEPEPPTTVTPPVGPPNPDIPTGEPGGGGNTETIPEGVQPDDVTGGAINNIPDVSGTHKYVISADNLNSLINYLGTTYQPTDADLAKDFKGVNPMDYIVSCKWYPFSPSIASNSVSIQLGGLTTGISCYPFNDYGVKVIYLGGVDINGYYNSWLDFEPYVTLSLYVPFCGTIDLDTKLWMYHKLDVYLAVDFNTGSCAALLMRDGALTSTIDGVCGIDVQMYGKNQGDYQNAMYQAQFAAKQAKLNNASTIIGAVTNPFGFSAAQGAANIGHSRDMLSMQGQLGSVSHEQVLSATGYQAGVMTAMPAQIMSAIGDAGKNVVGIMGAANAVKAAEWNVTHTAPHVTGAGSQDPFLQLAMPMFCRLYIRRAQMISGFNIGTYRATVGYSCMRSGRVGDFRGRIVCSGVWKTDGNLLGAEVDMIKAKLMKGVFVTNPE